MLEDMEKRGKENAIQFKTLELTIDGLLKQNVGLELNVVVSTSPFQLRSAKLDFP